MTDEFRWYWILLCIPWGLVVALGLMVALARFIPMWACFPIGIIAGFLARRLEQNLRDYFFL